MKLQNSLSKLVPEKIELKTLI